MAKSQPVRKEHWKLEPDEHDYPAAAKYLGLVMDDDAVDRTIGALKAAAVEHYLAKDLLRASRLALLPFDNAHVAADLKKVTREQKLSPVLLVRGSLSHDVALTIADGYHRVCASYHIDENARIPCRICDAPRAPARPPAAKRVSPPKTVGR